MKRMPTDRKILSYIYKEYYVSFESFYKQGDIESRSSKIYVPINIYEVAEKFNVDPDIIFGRLYYHLDKKYGYEQIGGTKVHLFSPKAGKDSNVVNFPLLGAIVSELEESEKKYFLSVILSIIAIIISALSFGLSL